MSGFIIEVQVPTGQYDIHTGRHVKHWRPLCNSIGVAYHYQTFKKADRIARMCYPDNYPSDKVRVTEITST